MKKEVRSAKKLMLQKHIISGLQKSHITGGDPTFQDPTNGSIGCFPPPIDQTNQGGSLCDPGATKQCWTAKAYNCV